jgi:hypothetical protein
MGPREVPPEFGAIKTPRPLKGWGVFFVSLATDLTPKDSTTRVHPTGPDSERSPGRFCQCFNPFRVARAYRT